MLGKNPNQPGESRMSLSVGTSSAASQALAALALLNNPSSSSTANAVQDRPFSATTETSQLGNAATGSATPSLSNEIMGLLTQMMEDGSGASGSSSTSTSTLAMSSLTLSSLVAGSLTMGSAGVSSLSLSAINPSAQSANSSTASAHGTHHHHGGNSDAVLQALNDDNDDSGNSETMGSASFAQTWESAQNQSTVQSTSILSMLDTLSKAGNAVATPQTSIIS